MNSTDDGDQPLGESPEIVLDLSFDNAGRHVPMHVNFGVAERVADIQRQWNQAVEGGAL